jgi:hypothetical protein
MNKYDQEKLGRAIYRGHELIVIQGRPGSGKKHALRRAVAWCQRSHRAAITSKRQRRTVRTTSKYSLEYISATDQNVMQLLTTQSLQRKFEILVVVTVADAVPIPSKLLSWVKSKDKPVHNTVIFLMGTEYSPSAAMLKSKCLVLQTACRPADLTEMLQCSKSKKRPGPPLSSRVTTKMLRGTLDFTALQTMIENGGEKGANDAFLNHKTFFQLLKNLLLHSSSFNHIDDVLRTHGKSKVVNYLFWNKNNVPENSIENISAQCDAYCDLDISHNDSLLKGCLPVVGGKKYSSSLLLENPQYCSQEQRSIMSSMEMLARDVAGEISSRSGLVDVIATMRMIGSHHGQRLFHPHHVIDGMSPIQVLALNDKTHSCVHSFTLNKKKKNEHGQSSLHTVFNQWPLYSN